MRSTAKRAAVYVPIRIHRALRKKAAALDRSISELVTAAVQTSLAEDEADTAAFASRAHEKSDSFSGVVKSMRRRGRL
jgi:hypothetical protein